jgi:hypothetical protein
MSAERPRSAYLEAVGRDLDAAARRQAQVLRRRRARLRLAAVGVSAIVLLTGSALAGAGILGTPAPKIVQATLNSLWDGSDKSMLAPTLTGARGMAFFDGDRLYRSPGRKQASVCLTVVAADLTVARSTRGGSCFARASGGYWPFGVISRLRADRQAIFGQIRAPGDASLTLEWPGAGPRRVPLGLDGHFLVELPLLPRARAEPVFGTLEIRDGAGRVVASRRFVGLTR